MVQDFEKINLVKTSQSETVRLFHQMHSWYYPNSCYPSQRSNHMHYRSSISENIIKTPRSSLTLSFGIHPVTFQSVLRKKSLLTRLLAGEQAAILVLGCDLPN